LIAAPGNGRNIWHPHARILDATPGEHLMKKRISALALGVLLCPLGAAGAVMSTISTSGKIASTPQQYHPLTNVRDATPDPVVLGAAGDESLSVSKLLGSGGLLNLSSHACSGPPAGVSPAGTAFANSGVSYQEVFTIESATLPAGTPVVIDIKVAAARSFMAVLTPGVGTPYLGDTASVSASAAIRFDAQTSTRFDGAFHEQQSWINPVGWAQTGIFASSPSANPQDVGDPNADAYTATVAGRVGSNFVMTLQTNVSTDSATGNPHEADGDGQLSIVWGADVVGGLAEIRASGVLFPPTSGATKDRAMDNLPPRPDSGAPEPASLGLLAAAGLAMRRRKRE
jgi:hypothetical protein